MWWCTHFWILDDTHRKTFIGITISWAKAWKWSGSHERDRLHYQHPVQCSWSLSWCPRSSLLVRCPWSQCQQCSGDQDGPQDWRVAGRKRGHCHKMSASHHHRSDMLWQCPQQLLKHQHQQLYSPQQSLQHQQIPQLLQQLWTRCLKENNTMHR